MSTTSLYDVIVVGAGLAGALVARHLADGGMQVVVLEATASPGGAAKSKNILSLLGTPEPYSLLESRWGRAAALEIWDLTYENLQLLNQCLEDTGQNIKRTGAVRPVALSDDVEVWKDSVTLLQDQGYEIELEDADAYQSELLIHSFDDVVFDGIALAEALLDHPNIIMDFNVEVDDVKPRDAGDLAVWGYKRYLWGDRVVLANGIHAVRFQDNLSKSIKPRYTHTIDAHNVPSQYPEYPMILQSGNVNIVPAGDIWHITGWGIDEQHVLGSIIDIAHHFCPEANVKVRYTGWVAQSTDDIPFIGTLPHTPNIYTINGLGAFGASWVFVAAKQLADFIMGNRKPRFLDISRLHAF